MYRKMHAIWESTLHEMLKELDIIVMNTCNFTRL